MNDFQEKTKPMINIKSKYIKSLRKNNLYYRAQAPKSPKSKINLEKYIYNIFNKKYSQTEDLYNIKIINEIITNQRSHIVAEFKDYLIKDDYSEFILKFYKLKESLKLLIAILNYYKQISIIFPNYILLNENKYLYKNIQRKQKLINYLEENEDKCFMNCKKEGYETDDFVDSPSKVFTSNILESILNESNNSQIKKSLFGVSTENSNFTDNEGDNKLNNLLNNIDKIEESRYNEFLNKKKLIINKNLILKDDSNSKKEGNLKDRNEPKLIKVKKIINTINNKNVIISRNRHKSVEISKYSRFSQKESKLKKIKKKAKTESNKNLLIDYNYYENLLKRKKDHFLNDKEGFNENNKKIIFNNIYKTDLYLNINNNIIIKETKKSKSKEKKSKDRKKSDKNIIDKLNLKKLKNLDTSRGIIHSDNRNYIKKNDINNLLLSINSLNKGNFRRAQITDSQNEYRHFRNKTEREKEKESCFAIMEHKKLIERRKNKTNDFIEKCNKNGSKIYSSKTFGLNQNSNKISLNIEVMNNNKLMINNFKNTLNNLMNIINKKSIKRNFNIKHNNIRNYKNSYSSRYSSSLLKKENNRFIESYNDSMIKTKYKSMKIKNKKIKITKENKTTFKNSLTSRSDISSISKFAQNYKNTTNITSLNVTKSGKYKTITSKSSQKINKKKNKGKINNSNKKNHSKNIEIINLTSRDSQLYERNRNKTNVKINYTSFIRGINQKLDILGNPLNAVKFYNILFERPKSFRNRNDCFKKLIFSDSNTTKRNKSLPKKLNPQKKVIENDFNNIIKERIAFLNKSVKCKRNIINNNILFTKNNSKKDSSLNIIHKKNIFLKNNPKDEKIKINKGRDSIKKRKYKIKRFNSTCSSKNNNYNINEINYSQIELRKKKYRDMYNDRKRFRINNNINNNNNKIKFSVSSYTDRISKKK